jgi:hypothetical protein
MGGCSGRKGQGKKYIHVKYISMSTSELFYQIQVYLMSQISTSHTKHKSTHKQGLVYF